MDKTFIDAQDVFLSKISQICSKFGLNNIMAQLYVILYLSNKPLCLDDMVERLKISKGSASVNIRALERYGVVRSIWVKGSRRDYYESEKDIARVVIDRMRSMAQGRLSELQDMVTSSYDTLNAVNSDDPEEKKSIEVFKQQLDKVRELHDKAQSIFLLFNSVILNKASISDKAEEVKIGASLLANIV